MEPLKLDREMKQGHRRGGFGIEILYPGVALGAGDSGVGAIGHIDHAEIAPGHLVPMHSHKDDEILSYMRGGQMIHRDSEGHVAELSRDRLMMNAGQRFRHEERMGTAAPVSMLQIFLRPHAGGLAPKVQFHALAETYSHGAWRLLAGPAGAPLEVRASVTVGDARLAEGQQIGLPAAASEELRLLYVFSGRVRLGAFDLGTGESLLFDGRESAPILARQDSDLLLFGTDPQAQVFTGGMFSGNLLMR